MDLIDVPLIETWKALETVVKKGKVKTIGVSNFSVARIEEIWDAAEIKPAVNQVELHPYFAQPELVQYCYNKVSKQILSHKIHLFGLTDNYRVLLSRHTRLSETTSSACQCSCDYTYIYLRTCKSSS